MNTDYDANVLGESREALHAEIARARRVAEAAS